MAIPRPDRHSIQYPYNTQNAKRFEAWMDHVNEALDNPTSGPGIQGPKGDPGERGADGIPGAPGPRGPSGPEGPPSPAGGKGDKGDTGAVGPQGPPGSDGAPGVGSQGPVGPQGPVGAKGDPGNAGPAGADGAAGGQGPPGGAGAPGSVWFEAAIAPSAGLGISGDCYLNTATGDVYKKTGAGWGSPIGSIRGATGPQGNPGTNGADGAPGAKGDKGDMGATGPQGPVDTAHAALTTTAHGGVCSSTDPRLSDPRAPTAHSHAQSDVTNLATALAGKSDTSHTHSSLAASGAVTSSGGGIGYATGAGGTISQLTSRSTGVTLNKLCGNITMFSAAQAAQAIVTFTLTNSFIAATDLLEVRHISATNGGAWSFSTVCGTGSATITVRNVSTASITEATPLRFVVFKAVTS